MPATFIPLPGRPGSDPIRSATATEQVFSTPVRWSLRVLAWLAFGVASYLAWHAVNQTSVAGCGVGTTNDCDVVLSSAWSKWLGIPVAVLGLACYAALAALSVLIGWTGSSAYRWIATVFVMLATLAAGASLWFIGLQIFAIGTFCKFCLVTDACGITIGALALWSATRWWYTHRGLPQARTSQPGLMALRSTIPGSSRGAPAIVSSSASPPSLTLAFAGATPLLILLIGGQVLFAGKTYAVHQVALNDSIKIVGAGSKQPDNEATSPTATSRTVMRPTDADPAQERTGETNPKSPDGKAPADASTENDANGDAAPPPVPEPPKRERVVSFLDGKVTLDIYQHPFIGSHEAPHIVVEMVSYDCPHCHKMHPFIQQALKRYGGQVGLLIMPVPLEKECNKLVTNPAASHKGACYTARTAIGISQLNPPAFERFHDFLMAGKEKPPEMERLIPKAYSLADRNRLRELARGHALDKQIESYVDLYASLQSQGKKEFGLPVQILGDHIMTGSVEKVDDVFKAWEENLGVQAK
jgi:uncharacterized membrane protein/thiol-disulfide isomerase/thioredoxin